MFLALTSGVQEGWTRVRVDVPNAATLQRLEDSGYDLMDCVPGLGTDDVILAPGEQAKLAADGYTFQFVSAMEDPSNWGVRHHSQPAPADDYRYHYFDADQILAFLEGYRTQYPNYVTRYAIGASFNGETIWAYRIGRPVGMSVHPVNNIVVEGLIHAREWITGSCIMHIARKSVDLLTQPQPTPQLINQAVWIIPMVNPDGYRFTWTDNRYWRKNRRPNGDGTYGVDLNRNFSKGWGGNNGSSSQTNSDIYRGTTAFSEPETQAVRSLLQSLPRVGGFIDYHSYAQMILAPWGYTTTAPADSSLLDTYGQAIQTQMDGFGATYQEGQCSRILYVASGISNDYVYDAYHVPAFGIELRDTGQYGFVLPENQIYPTQDEVWAGFYKYLKMVGR
ncbi:MAG TPA: M14 family zinc carboxypeptidase [Fimbriimonadaceae bacterium]|nr:M14 family zinc carboxypeptidase [Fimbriimonadaceae bacterium]